MARFGSCSSLRLRNARATCVCLSYVVHGRSNDSGEWDLARDRERHARKREALMAHTSQISLSKSRLLRWADQPESFEPAEPRGAIAIGAARRSCLRFRSRRTTVSCEGTMCCS